VTSSFAGIPGGHALGERCYLLVGYLAAALGLQSHPSIRGVKPSFCLAYALQAPRSRIA